MSNQAGGNDDQPKQNTAYEDDEERHQGGAGGVGEGLDDNDDDNDNSPLSPSATSNLTLAEREAKWGFSYAELQSATKVVSTLFSNPSLYVGDPYLAESRLYTMITRDRKTKRDHQDVMKAIMAEEKSRKRKQERQLDLATIQRTTMKREREEALSSLLTSHRVADDLKLLTNGGGDENDENNQQQLLLRDGPTVSATVSPAEPTTTSATGKESTMGGGGDVGTSGRPRGGARVEGAGEGRSSSSTHTLSNRQRVVTPSTAATTTATSTGATKEVSDSTTDTTNSNGNNGARLMELFLKRVVAGAELIEVFNAPKALLPLVALDANDENEETMSAAVFEDVEYFDDSSSKKKAVVVSGIQPEALLTSMPGDPLPGPAADFITAQNTIHKRKLNQKNRQKESLSIHHQAQIQSKEQQERARLTSRQQAFATQQLGPAEIQHWRTALTAFYYRFWPIRSVQTQMPPALLASSSSSASSSSTSGAAASTNATQKNKKNNSSHSTYSSTKVSLLEPATNRLLHLLSVAFNADAHTTSTTITTTTTAAATVTNTTAATGALTPVHVDMMTVLNALFHRRRGGEDEEEREAEDAWKSEKGSTEKVEDEVDDFIPPPTPRQQQRQRHASSNPLQESLLLSFSSLQQDDVFTGVHAEEAVSCLSSFVGQRVVRVCLEQCGGSGNTCGGGRADDDGDDDNVSHDKKESPSSPSLSSAVLDEASIVANLKHLIQATPSSLSSSATATPSSSFSHAAFAQLQMGWNHNSGNDGEDDEQHQEKKEVNNNHNSKDAKMVATDGHLVTAARRAAAAAAVSSTASTNTTTGSAFVSVQRLKTQSLQYAKAVESALEALTATTSSAAAAFEVVLKEGLLKAAIAPMTEALVAAVRSPSPTASNDSSQHRLYLAWVGGVATLFSASAAAWAMMNHASSSSSSSRQEATASTGGAPLLLHALSAYCEALSALLTHLMLAAAYTFRMGDGDVGTDDSAAAAAAAAAPTLLFSHTTALFNGIRLQTPSFPPEAEADGTIIHDEFYGFVASDGTAHHQYPNNGGLTGPARYLPYREAMLFAAPDNNSGANGDEAKATNATAAEQQTEEGCIVALTRQSSERLKMNRTQKCHTCKGRYKYLHPYYYSMCRPCGEYNYDKRLITRDLRGKVVLLTGCRIKIGYAMAVSLLRCGATLIGTTRFVMDALLRFTAEPDYRYWKHRLHLYSVDLRDMWMVTEFCAFLGKKFPKMFAIVNNAAQTIARTPAYTAELRRLEANPPAALCDRLRDDPTAAEWRGFFMTNSSVTVGRSLHLEHHPTARPIQEGEFDDDNNEEGGVPLSTAATAAAAKKDWLSSTNTATAATVTTTTAATATGTTTPAAAAAVPGTFHKNLAVVDATRTQEMQTFGGDALTTAPLHEEALTGVLQKRYDRYDTYAEDTDRRAKNSWTMNLGEVQGAEAAEVMAINALSPFILNSKLKPLLMNRDGDDGCDEDVQQQVVVEAVDGEDGKDDDKTTAPLSNRQRKKLLQAAAQGQKVAWANRPGARFIINVSAMEGQFYRHKLTTHPHTNMAKAALNMMTRTSAEDYAADGIFMNSVDTGWITDESPAAKKEKREEQFACPLDEVDAAARCLDLIYTDSREYGKFWKNFKVIPW